MAKASTYDEQTLINNVAKGDAKAFDQLVCGYGRKVYAFVRRHCRSHELAEDIVQDIFTQLWITREGLTSIKNLDGFLYILSRNVAYNTLKRELKVQQRQFQYQVVQELQQTQEPEMLSMKIDLINSAVQALPPQQRKVWELARREGLKQSQIAEQMKISRETVKKYLVYATASIVKSIESRFSQLLLLLVILQFF